MVVTDRRDTVTELENARLLVVADEKTGRVVAAGADMRREGDAPPARVEFVPLPGQIVREVLAPIELLRYDEQPVFDEWRLEVEGEDARLVRHRDEAPPDS